MYTLLVKIVPKQIKKTVLKILIKYILKMLFLLFCKNFSLLSVLYSETLFS